MARVARNSHAQRVYRKEAERLILWAIDERGRAFSSLTTDDAIAYQTFVRRPSPRERWVGPPRPRDSVEWRPFTGGLSAPTRRACVQANSWVPCCATFVLTSTAGRGFTSLAKAANPAGWRCHRWQPMRLINICLNDGCRSHGSAGTRLRQSSPALGKMRKRGLRARTCGTSCAGSSWRPLV